MNVIEIQDLLKKIGAIEIRYNEDIEECLVDGENINLINKNKFKVIRDEYQQKLNIQLNQKSDTNLLVGFLDDISKLVQILYSNYHSCRIKLTESKFTSKNLKSEKVLSKICQIIYYKIEVLEEIQNELKILIKNFDYKLDNDFGSKETQSIEKPFENEELNLKYLPKLNVAERFKLLNLLKIAVVFENLDMETKSKSKLLALTMGISLDNARHLLSGSYKSTSESQNKSLEQFLLKENIIL